MGILLKYLQIMEIRHPASPSTTKSGPQDIILIAYCIVDSQDIDNEVLRIKVKPARFRRTKRLPLLEGSIQGQL